MQRAPRILSSAVPRPLVPFRTTSHAPSIKQANLGQQRQASSMFSPAEWIRSKIRQGTRFRKSDSVKEVQEAKEEAVKRGDASVFDVVEKSLEAKPSALPSLKAGKAYTEHKYSTAAFKISPRKLNLLSRQIAGKPIDSAILQMVFSDKRAAGRIKSTLCLARDHALAKGLRRERLVVSETWVNKSQAMPRLDIKGRARMGLKHHRYSRLHVLLKEGATREEVLAKKKAKQLKAVVSAGLVREDVPLRNPGPAWAW